MMLKIGLTGGIGSGKTVVCEAFKCLGIPVYQADTEAKRLYDTDEILRRQMIELFGSDLYKGQFLDRKILASIIFNDREALNTINKLVHPAVERDFNDWASQQHTVPYVIQEAAILFESGIARLMDKTITISAPETLRIWRASLRDNVSTEDIRRRIENQMNDNERNCLADFIIVSNDITPMLPQILNIHNKLIG
ncbi:MAG: dephospho-CoA kinase [Prevotellaceae bacterium]|jgi:dephospho-CoA kinase|nr:dephospho-CoA kinase [Prevotellaceae bacterium]